MDLHHDQLVAVSKLVAMLDDFEAEHGYHLGAEGYVFEGEEIVGRITRIELDGLIWTHGMSFDD